MEARIEPSGSQTPPPSATKHSGPSIEVPPGMSKNAAKKLARKQKLEATKHDRRAAERLKKKENKRARYLAAQASTSDAGTAENGIHKRRVSAGSSTAHTEGGGEGGNKKRKAGEGEKEYFNARLVIDCGFDELMLEKESSSMTQQLMYLYSANRNAKVPFGEVILTGQDRPGDCLKDVDPEQLNLVPKEASSSTGEEKGEASSGNPGSIENNRIGQAMDGKLRGVWRRWKRVTIYRNGGIESLLGPPLSLSTTSTDAVDAVDTPAESSVSSRHFPPEETRQALDRILLSDAIYLTADTDDTLDSLEPGKTYIIGGIVDKNRYKGLCRAKADRLGIRAAKLPLSQEMLQAVERNVRAQRESIQDEGARDEGEEGEKGFVGRKVLTVNQVVEILTAWTETRDWVKALEKALPRRKLKQRGPVAKPTSEKESHQGVEVAENGGEANEEDEDALKNGS